MTSCFVAWISNPGERFGKPFYEVDVPSPLSQIARVFGSVKSSSRPSREFAAADLAPVFGPGTRNGFAMSEIVVAQFLGSNHQRSATEPLLRLFGKILA